jgi:hypothetical protein
MKWPRSDLLTLGILIATVAGVIVALEAGGGSGSPASATKSTVIAEPTVSVQSIGATSTGPGPKAIVKRGSWEGTAGPLTLTVNEVERQRTTVRLTMTAASDSTVTLYFYSNFQATDANGHSYKAQPETEPLDVDAGTPLKTSVTLAEVPEVSLSLTVAFTTIYTHEYIPGVENGIKVEDVPVPK